MISIPIAASYPVDSTYKSRLFMAIESPPPPEQCTLSLVDFRFPYFLFRRSILPIALDTIGRKAVSEREREKSSTWLAAFSLELTYETLFDTTWNRLGDCIDRQHTLVANSIFPLFSLYINCPNVLLRKGSKGKQADSISAVVVVVLVVLFIHPGTLARVTRARLRLRTFDIDSALIETQFPSLFARLFSSLAQHRRRLLVRSSSLSIQSPCL